MTFGVAVRHGNDAGPDFFRPVMQAEASGEQAIAEGVMDDIVFGQTGGDKGTGGQFCPGFQIPSCITEHGRPAGGAG